MNKVDRLIIKARKEECWEIEDLTDTDREIYGDPEDDQTAEQEESKQ